MKRNSGCAMVLLCVLGMMSARAVAGNSSLAPLTYNYIFQTCGETASTGDPTSAVRAVDPAYMLKNYIQNRDDHYVDLSAIKNITLLQGTLHGNLRLSVTNTGRTTFHYDPTPNYIGNDSAIFLAEFEGKVYKIVLELHVFEGPATPEDFGASTCPAPQLIKVTSPAKTDEAAR